jgi:hypothetical protein
MRRFKIIYVLPDGMDDTWNKETVVYVHQAPYLGEMVNLPNIFGYSQPFKVTGLRTWVTRHWWRRREHIKIYLNNAQMDLNL